MTIRLIQAGIGGHGRGVARRYVVPSADFELVGLVDLNEELLREAGEEFGIPPERRCTDKERAFREFMADAVLIEAFSPAHYEIAASALKNGLHVLVEKPFTVTLAEARELIALAERAGRRIMVNQNYRFLPAALTLKRALRERPLGRPLFVEAHFFCDHAGKPYQRRMEHYILLEMTVHHVDMIRFLLESEIVSVTGKTWNEPNSGYAGAPHVQAAYETEAGVPVFYLSSLIAKGAADPWEGVWRVQCERGTLRLDDLGDGFGVYATEADGTIRKLPAMPIEREGIAGVLAEFAAAIRAGREPSVSGRDNFHTLAALFATAESAAFGRPIRPATD